MTPATRFHVLRALLAVTLLTVGAAGLFDSLEGGFIVNSDPAWELSLTPPHLSSDGEVYGRGMTIPPDRPDVIYVAGTTVVPEATTPGDLTVQSTGAQKDIEVFVLRMNSLTGAVEGHISFNSSQVDGPDTRDYIVESSGRSGTVEAGPDHIVWLMFNTFVPGAYQISPEVVLLNDTDGTLRKQGAVSLLQHVNGRQRHIRGRAMSVDTATGRVFVAGTTGPNDPIAGSEADSVLAMIENMQVAYVHILGTEGHDFATCLKYYDGRVYIGGGTIGDMDFEGPGIAKPNYRTTDSYIHIYRASNPPEILNYWQAALDFASNLITSIDVSTEGIFSAGRMRIVGQVAIVIGRMALDPDPDKKVLLLKYFTVMASNSGSRTDQARMYAIKNHYGRLYFAGSSSAPYGGHGYNTQSSLVNKERSNAMIGMNDALDSTEKEWVRYTVDEGTSRLRAIDCNDVACFAAGNADPAELPGNSNSISKLLVWRLPLCTNGHRTTKLEGYTPYNRCWECEPGEYQNIPNQPTCKVCPAGSISATKASASCTRCEAGYYQPLPGQSECLQCPPGQWSSVGSAACLPCAPGSYATQYATKNCTLCPLGSANPSTGATSIASCGLCAAGSYAATTGQAICSKCEPGTYLNSTGSTANNCLKCPVTTHLASAGGQSLSQCVPCPMGHYCPTEGVGAAIPCIPGEHQNQTAQTSCHGCVSGQYSPAGAPHCLPCPPGTVNSNPTASGSCAKCKFGEYQDAAGQQQCKVCEVDHYCPARGTATPTKCPFGSQSEAESVSLGRCRCPTGTWGNPLKDIPCRPCPANSECRPGTQKPKLLKGYWSDPDYPSVIYSCTPKSACVGGQHPEDDSGVANATTSLGLAETGLLTMAAQGSATDLEQRLMATSDSLCDAGYVGSACSTCTSGYFRSKGYCEACPSNSAAPEVLYSLLAVLTLFIAVALVLGACVRGGWRAQKSYRRRHLKGRGVTVARSAGPAAAEGFQDERGDGGQDANQVTGGNIDATGERTGHSEASSDEEEAAVTPVNHQGADEAPPSQDPGRDVENDSSVSGPSTDVLKVTAVKVQGGTRTFPLRGASEDGSDSDLKKKMAKHVTYSEENSSTVDSEDPLRGALGIVPGEGPAENTTGSIESGRETRLSSAQSSTENLLVHRVTIDTPGVSTGTVEHLTDGAKSEDRPFLSRLRLVISKWIKFYQLLYVIFNIKAPWPSVLSAIGSTTSITTLDVNEIFAMECASDETSADLYASRYRIRFYIPAALIVCAALFFVVCYMGKVAAGALFDFRSPLTGNLAEEMVRACRMHFRHTGNAFLYIAVTLLLLFYISIHSAAMELFGCHEVGSGSFFLTAEPTIQCYVSGPWTSLLPVNILSMIIFSIGTPLTLGSIALLHGRNPSSDASERFSGLWVMYRKQYYWFECVNFAFKLLYGSGLILSVLSATDQLFFMLAMLLINVSVQLLFLPYRYRSDNILESWLLVTLFATALAGVCFELGDDESMSEAGLQLMQWLIVALYAILLTQLAIFLLGGVNNVLACGGLVPLIVNRCCPALKERIRRWRRRKPAVAESDNSSGDEFQVVVPMEAPPPRHDLTRVGPGFYGDAAEGAERNDEPGEKQLDDEDALTRDDSLMPRKPPKRRPLVGESLFAVVNTEARASSSHEY